MRRGWIRTLGALPTYAAHRLRAADADQVRAVIFSQGRTGSTLLSHLIASAGDVHRAGELLALRSNRHVRQPVAYVLGRSRLTSRHFLFNLKIRHLTARRPPADPAAFLRSLVDDGWRILSLKRANKLRQAVSNETALRRRSYHKRDDAAEDIRLELNLDRVVWRIEDRLEQDRLEDDALGGLPHLDLVYERDLEDEREHQRTADRVFAYLSLPSAPVRTTLRRINPHPLEEIVRNYAELRRCMRDRGWSGYLA